MNLDEAFQLAPLYADGELPAEQRVEFDRWLSASPELTAEVEQWRALRRACRRVMAAESLPAGLALRIRDDVRRRPGLSPVVRWGGGLLLAAAAILLAVVFRPAGLTGNGAARQLAQAALVQVPVQLFSEAHRHCAEESHHDGFACARSGGDVAGRIRREVGLQPTVLVPQLAGYEFVGACSCVPREYRDLHLQLVHAHYESQTDPSDVVSVFTINCPVQLRRGGMCQTEQCAGRTYEVAGSAGVTIVKWITPCGRASYAFTGRCDSAKLRGLADDVQVAADGRGWIHVPLAVAP